MEPIETNYANQKDGKQTVGGRECFHMSVMISNYICFPTWTVLQRRGCIERKCPCESLWMKDTDTQANSGESLDPILWTFSRVFVCKLLIRENKITLMDFCNSVFTLWTYVVAYLVTFACFTFHFLLVSLFWTRLHCLVSLVSNYPYLPCVFGSLCFQSSSVCLVCFSCVPVYLSLSSLVRLLWCNLFTSVPLPSLVIQFYSPSDSLVFSFLIIWVFGLCLPACPPTCQPETLACQIKYSLLHLDAFILRLHLGPAN